MIEQQPSDEQREQTLDTAGAPPDAAAPILARPVRATGFEWRPPAERQTLDLSGLTRREAALDLLLVLAVVLTPYVFNMVVAPNFVDVADEGLPSAGLLRVQKLFDLLVAAVLLVYLSVRNRTPLRAFGVRADGLGAQLACAPLALFGVYVAFIPMVLIVGVIVLLFPETQSDLAGRYELISLLAGRSLAETIALMVPVAIHEEIIFRGLFIPYLRRLGMGWAGAALISSAVFAALHGAQGWLGMLQVFALGLAFAAAFVLTRSLLVVALAHFGFNTIQVLVAPLLLKLAEQAGGIAASP
jgi:membrane protease YdiL (CAAX protease family)